jgi:CRP/FNR family transcriptional regulator, cyclic AMP receptor protein
MTSEALPYVHRRHMAVAGILALLSLSTAAIYEWRSTPYTMVLFLMGGATLLLAAMILFGWTLWKDVRSRLEGVATRSFGPGEVIYRQGDPADHIFVITQGQVEIVHADPAQGDVLLSRLAADEYFGETAILSRSPRQATARAVDEVNVLAIQRRDFLRLYESLPALRARIDRQQTHRLASFEQRGRS